MSTYVNEKNPVTKRSAGRVIRVGVLATSWLVTMIAAPSSHAQSEDDIKAAYLLNFARYVEWPKDAFASDSADVRICTFGAEGFDSVVTEIVEGKTVGSRGFEVVAVASAEAASDCHILYLGASRGDHSTVLAALGTSSVFAVADDDGFAKDGGTANFYRSGKKIRFEINPSAARDAGLKVSSRLLRLARLVE